MSELLNGYCCEDETADRALSFTSTNNFIKTRGLTLSSLGCGTYLGNDDNETQVTIQEALCELVCSGLNVIDTAPNYRNGRSEEAIGAALREVCAKGVSRKAIFVSTKVGILPDTIGHYPKETICGQFCFSPEYILSSVEASRNRLGVDTLDCLYLHNFDEAQVSLSGEHREDVIDAMMQVIKTLLEKNWIRTVGLATWSGLRVEVDHPAYIDLLGWEKRFRMHGLDKYFGMIQLPLGVWAPEALLATVQKSPLTGQPMTPLRVANELGLTVIANSCLLQGEILSIKPPDFSGNSELNTAQQFIQWTRSQPDVAITLVGMKNKNSVKDGKQIMALPKCDYIGLK